MSPSLWRKKPVVIEAFDWDGTIEEATTIIDWILSGGGTARWHEPEEGFKRDCRPYEIPTHIAIDTLEGTMRAMPGDYIIRGVEGEFYPCKPAIFATTYEKCSEDERG